MKEKFMRIMRVSAIFCTLATVLCISTIDGQPARTPHSGSVVGAQCRRAEIPINRPHGTNRLSSGNDPVYKLSLRNNGQHDYTVSVQLGNRLLPFSDAFVSAETNSSCGVGEFFYDGGDFYRVVQPPLDCPLLLTTNRKSVMQGLPPLRWKAPSCGCVRFRAMVIEASTVYYADQVNSTEGALVTTLCVFQPDALPHTQRELTIEERTDVLCQVTEQNSGLSIIQRPRFLHNHRLELRYMDIQSIDLALSARRHDINACCAKKDEERRECLRDVHRRRVDEFCADGVPDIPFTVLRAAFMRQREEACCWKLGKSRYSCFSENAELNSAKRSVDYSLDEADPLNDLADYEEERFALEKKLGAIFIARAPTPTPFPPSPTTTTPTTTTTTPTPSPTTTTSSPSPPPQPPLPSLLSPGPSSPVFPSPPPIGHRPWTQRQAMEGEGGGGDSRRVGMVKVPGVRGSGEMEEPSLVSREIGEQGGRSIEKTFAALQRRMWKLSLKTQCCQAGMSAAQAAYGNFNAVWKQCTHSAAKYLATQSLPHGHKMCSSQFHRCCMEIAISLPPEVVTMAPDTASSREWDRDRHLVHSVYLPPYARSHHPHPDMTSRQRHAELSSSRGKSSAERRRGLLTPKTTRLPLSAYRSAVRHSLLVDEPEIDEEPQTKRSSRPQRRPQSRERGGISRSRLADLDEDLGSRRQRRLRKLNSRERKKSGRRSRERQGRLRALRRDMDDDLEAEEEEPVLKKTPRRRLNSGGRSKERRNRNGKPRQASLPPSVEQVEQEDIQRENPAPHKSRHNPQRKNGKIHSAEHQENPGAHTAAERRHELEAAQLRKLFAEIADDVEDEEDQVDEEADSGSEESPDSLGLLEPEDNTANDEKDDDDEDDDDESDENEDLVDVDQINENVGKLKTSQQEKPVSDPQDSEVIAMKRNSQERELHSPQTTPNPTTAIEKREPKKTPQQPVTAPEPITTSKPATTPKPTTSKPTTSKTTTSKPKTTTTSKPTTTSLASSRQASQEILSLPTRRRMRLLRLRSRGGLSEEDGHSRHSGGRSSQRRKRKFHHGRKRYRNLRHHKQRSRARARWNRLGLDEALEEDL